MEPYRTIELLLEAGEGMREDIPFQITREVGGILVSVVRPPTWDYDTVEQLNRMVYDTLAGKTRAGCATGTVPDGADVIVAVTGLSDSACTIAAESIAAKAARICTGETLI